METRVNVVSMNELVIDTSENITEEPSTPKKKESHKPHVAKEGWLLNEHPEYSKLFQKFTNKS